MRPQLLFLAPLQDIDRAFFRRRRPAKSAPPGHRSTLLRAIGEGLVVGFPASIRALHVSQLEGEDAATHVVDVLLATDRWLFCFERWQALSRWLLKTLGGQTRAGWARLQASSSLEGAGRPPAGGVKGLRVLRQMRAAEPLPALLHSTLA